MDVNTVHTGDTTDGGGSKPSAGDESGFQNSGKEITGEVSYEGEYADCPSRTPLDCIFVQRKPLLLWLTQFSIRQFGRRPKPNPDAALC